MLGEKGGGTKSGPNDTPTAALMDGVDGKERVNPGNCAQPQVHQTLQYFGHER